MDSYYNLTAAVDRLDEISNERYNSPHSVVQMSRMASPSAHYEAIPVGRTWRLVEKNTNEEVVGAFQGIIYNMDLPPFKEKIGKSSAHLKYLRQSVSIAGFSVPSFDKTVNSVLDLHAILGRGVGLKDVQQCGMISTINNIQVIEASNRYFSPRIGNGLEMQEVQLSSDIDPYGHLAKAAKAAGMIHGEDNYVAYYKRTGTRDGNYKYVATKPAVFGVGDIVELQVSFMLYPLKEGKFKSSMVLRTITLLDGQFTQDRIRDMIKSRACVENKPPMSLKRKIRYGEELISATRAKLAQMDLDKERKGDGEVDKEVYADAES